MPEMKIEMNFCRRCGSKLSHGSGPAYTCENGHTLFLNSAPGVAVALINEKNEVLILERASDPGKGLWDLPGGFCDEAETLEAAARREVAEETGLLEADYTTLKFVMSAINTYDYGGESLSVVDSVFLASMRSSKQPVAADDAAAVLWVPLRSIDLQKVCFPSVRAGLEEIIKKHPS